MIFGETDVDCHDNLKEEIANDAQVQLSTVQEYYQILKDTLIRLKI